VELIKKIKDAEKQAAEIVKQAETQALRQAEDLRKAKSEKLKQAETARKKAIDEAVARSEIEGQNEVEKLQSQGQKDRQELRQRTAPKIQAAATKVMDYLKG